MIQLLGSQEKSKLIMLSFLITMSAIMEAVGIASVMPFIGLVSDPQLIETNIYIKWLYNYADLETFPQFVVLVGALVILLITISTAVRTVTLTRTLDFIFLKESQLSHQMLDGLLKLSYLDLIEYKKDEIKKIIFSDVNKVVVHVMQPALIIFSNAVAIIFILIMLLIIQPAATIIVTAICGLYFIVTYFLIRKKLTTIGQDKFQADQGRFNVVENALSDLKMLKIEGTQAFLSSYFEKFANVYARNYAKGQLYAQLPRYLFELVLFGGVVGLVILISVESALEGATIIPYLAIFAFAGYKMMPSANNIFYNLSTLRYSLQSLTEYENKYKNILAMVPEMGSVEDEAFEKVKFSSLELRNITYSYSTGDPILQGVNLKVEAGRAVCFMGKSGSGKTSLMDLIACLMDPLDGEILVNGTVMAECDVRAWQRLIAYVPQNPVFFGGSIRNNIEGYDNPINDQRMREIIACACLEDLIDNNGDLDRPIGDFGSKLSGGQKQRLALARALARGASVLLLDEATSALDLHTEMRVLANLKQLENVTIIMIAHRKECMEAADSVFQIEDGNLEQVNVY